MIRRTIESGHAAFYVLVILPFTMVLTWAYINISTWNSLRDALQKESAAFAADLAQKIPYTELAAEFQGDIHTAITNKYDRLQDIHVKASFENQVATVTIEGTMSQAFNFGFPSSAFHISRSTSAQLVPGDYVIIMSDGASLRPPLGTTGKTKWESWDSVYFPATNTFAYKKAPQGTEIDSIWRERWKTPDYQNWATQACFNPAFSPLKFAAISLVNALSSFPANRLEVLLTPGSNNSAPYQTIRGLHESNLIPGGFIDNDPKSIFPVFADPFLPGAYSCALFSSAEHDLVGNYTIPDSFIEAGYLSHDAASGNIPINIIATPFVSHFKFNLYHALYWDIAKRDLPLANGTPNIAASLHMAIIDVTTALRRDDSIKRGNLALFPNRQIFVFSDNLSNVSDFLTPDNLQTLKNNKLFINFIAWMHPYLSPSARAQLEADVAKLNQLALNENISIFITTSAENLANKIVPLLITKTRRSSYHDYD